MAINLPCRLLPSRAETQICVGKPDLRYAERVNWFAGGHFQGR